MKAVDGLPTRTHITLSRRPFFVDPIRRRIRWFYHHPRIQKIEGYHCGILCCAIASAIAMVINLTFTIWGFEHYNVQDGVGTILDGSCSETKKLANWTHLGINFLSTLLLGASNYTMQCLSSPTREDIDRAHSQNIWLNIGTPSIRNLLRISRSRMLLWWLVAISSIPLHLMYNSAVFTTLSAREYTAFLVQRDFLTGTPFDISGFVAFSPQLDRNGSDFTESLNQVETVAHRLQDGQSSLQKLANKDCIGTYEAEFISSHGNVLAVTSDSKFYLHGTENISFVEDGTGNSSILQVWSSQSQGATSDSPWFRDTEIDANTATWHLNGYNIEYCLSQTVEDHCKVQFSGAIMVVVNVCNLCKMIIMGHIAWRRPSQPLVTVGDAVASFLDHPDLTTMGNCLAGKNQFEEKRSSGPSDDRDLRIWGEGTMRCDLGASYWFRAVSMRRWILLSLL